MQARGLGYTRLRVTPHPQNAAMKALARRHASALTFEDGETVGFIDLGPDVPGHLPSFRFPPLPARPALAPA